MKRFLPRMIKVGVIVAVPALVVLCRSASEHARKRFTGNGGYEPLIAGSGFTAEEWPGAMTTSHILPPL